MAETDTTPLIDEVVREVVARVRDAVGTPPASSPESPIALVLSAGAGDAAIRAAREIVERGHTVVGVGVSSRADAQLRAAASGIAGAVTCGSVGGTRPPAGVCAVVAPCLSVGDAAKLQGGTLDDVAPEWLWAGLASGVRVLASPGEGFAVPDGSPLARVVEGLRGGCERLGVQWCDDEGLPIALSARVATAPESGPVHLPSGGTRALVTETMVANLGEGTTEIVAPMGAVVTPLARDLAKRRGIVVRFRT